MEGSPSQPGGEDEKIDTPSAAPTSGQATAQPHSSPDSASSSSGLKAAKPKERVRNKPYARPAGSSQKSKPSSTDPIMLALALFRTGDNSKQLAGTVFLKTAPNQSVERVVQAFCRWSQLPPDACTLFDGRTQEQLDPQHAISSTGLTNSSPVIIYIAKDAPSPSAQAQAAPFTIVDVVDSELAGLGSGLGM